MLEFYDTCWLIRSILSGVRSLGLGQSWFYYLCTGHPWVSYLVPQFSSIVLCLVRINQGYPNKSLGHLFMVKMLLIYYYHCYYLLYTYSKPSITLGTKNTIINRKEIACSSGKLRLSICCPSRLFFPLQSLQLCIGSSPQTSPLLRPFLTTGSKREPQLLYHIILFSSYHLSLSDIIVHICLLIYYQFLSIRA